MIRSNAVCIRAPDFDETFKARLHDLFRWRRDVRRFRSTSVPSQVLDDLLEIACLAPSVGLSQPWRFVTVDNPSRRAAVRAIFEATNIEALAHQDACRAALYAKLKLASIDEAPRHFAVFAEANPEQGHGLGRQSMPATTAYSAVLAVHTLWLAARAIGLGLGWVSILDPVAVAKALDVPQHWTFIGYFCLGYPKAEDDTPELERAQWERRRCVEGMRIAR